MKLFNYRIRKWQFWAVGLLLFWFFLGPLIGFFVHRTVKRPDTSAAIPGMMIADLHADSLLWDLDLDSARSPLHVTLPVMRKTGLGIQAFTLVSEVPLTFSPENTGRYPDVLSLLMAAQMRAVATWFFPMQRIIRQVQALERLELREGAGFRILRSSDDLSGFLEDQKKNSLLTAGFLGIEGAALIEKNLSDLDLLHRLGIRMLAPVHFFDNDLAGSAHGLKKHGLTETGRLLLRRMKERGMILDLAHMAPASIADIFAEKNIPPVLISHTGVKGTCDRNRNISDDVIRKVAAAGGLIGIGYFSYALCGEEVSHIVAAILHVRSVAGSQVIASGSDWDGGIRAIITPEQFGLLQNELLKTGLNREEVAAISGGNVIRFLSRHLPRKQQ